MTMFSNFKTQLITLRMFRIFPDNLAQKLVYSDWQFIIHLYLMRIVYDCKYFVVTLLW
jgi:hypothetical protein